MAFACLPAASHAQGASGAQSGSPGAPAGPAAPGGQGTPGPTNAAGAPGSPQSGTAQGGRGGRGGGTTVTVGQSGTLANGSSRPNPDPAQLEFDLNRAIRDALYTSSAIEEAQRNARISERRADEYAASARPDLRAQGSATRYDAATNVTFGEQTLQVLPDHLEQLSIVSQWDLDLLGLVRAQVNQARLESLADRFTVNQITSDRILDVQIAYYELLRAIHQVQVAESTLRNAQERERVATELERGGVGQRIDELRARTDVAQAERDLASASNDRDVAQASFNDVVGMPLNAPVVLQDVPGVTVGVDIPTGTLKTGVVPPPPAPVQPTPAAPVQTPPPGTETTTPPKAVVPALQTVPAPVPPVSNAPTLADGTVSPYNGLQPFTPPAGEVAGIQIDQSINAALTRRPEILQAETLTRAENLGVRIARSGNEPTFSLSASGNYYPTVTFQTPRQRTAQITATVSIPLYDPGATRARVDEARLSKANADTRLAATRSGVTLEVRQAYLNLRTAVRQVQAANAELSQAVAARELAQVRYEGQVGLFLEVTDAQSALVRAENAQVDAVYNYLTARARFERAVGTPTNAANASGAPASGATPNSNTTTPAGSQPQIPATTTPPTNQNKTP